MRLAGIRRGETYPEPPRSSGNGLSGLVQIGFDNSISDQNANYPDPGTSYWIIRGATDGTKLRVPLNGFTPGNTLLMGMSLAFFDGAGSGASNISGTVYSAVKLGSTQKVIKVPFLVFPPAVGGALIVPFAWLASVTPDIDAETDIEVNIILSNGGTDSIAINGGGAMLFAAEFASDFVSQVSAGALIDSPVSPVFPP